MRKIAYGTGIAILLAILISFTSFIPVWPEEKICPQETQEDSLCISELSWWGELRNSLAFPVMYLVTSPVSGESPQQTHYWNNRFLSSTEMELVEANLGVPYEGDPNAGPVSFWGFPVNHIGIIESLGWQHYVVVEPESDVGVWFAGSVWNDGGWISRIPQTGPVRLLVGPGDAVAFGVNQEGEQIRLRLIGVSKLGDEDFSHLPLL